MFGIDKNWPPVSGLNQVLLPSHSPLFIGGVPDLSELPVEAVTWPPVPLAGCVRRVWINWRAVPLDPQHIISGRNLHDCDGTACGGDVCFNAGSCILSTDNKPNCKCLTQFMGERCEKQASCEEVGCENNGRCVKEDKSVKCQCPAGWTGPFCNIEVPLGMPHFGGDGYLVVDTKHGLAKRGGGPQQPQDPVMYLFLNFSTAHHDGMILWASEEDGFLGVGLEKGLGKVAWGRTPRDGRAVLLPGSLLSDGSWHTLTLQLNNRELMLSTDKAVTHLYSTNLRTISNGILYLGGFPDEKKVYTETFGHFQSQFSGCVKELAWNKHFSVVDFSKYKGENLGSCDLFYYLKDLQRS